jgi:ABC-2 type transport system permease protein
MTRWLIRKLLRDVRTGLIVVALLLIAFQCLWAKITDRLTGELLPKLAKSLPLEAFFKAIFEGPGKIILTLMGGESIRLWNFADMMSISYVHPLTQIILCVWAIGRAAAAITGEIDRGTMELLLAQPVSRPRVLGAHLVVDAVAIPVICLSLWGGTCLGTYLVGLWEPGATQPRVNPLAFGPSLLNVATLLFAISGYTMWLSARGRFRGRVLGLAVLLTLLQFLINVVGQLLDAFEPLRPFTVFYYYQPQQIILRSDWASDLRVWERCGVLFLVGVGGYLGALWSLVRRDLPAPL